MNNNINFGAWLKDWRERRGLSVRHIAALVEVSHTYIWKLENEKIPPSLRFLRKFAGVFDDPTVYLAAGRLMPEEDLEKVKNTSTIIENLKEFWYDDKTSGHPLAGIDDDPDLAKFILKIYSTLKSTSYNKQDLDFILNLINSYFISKEK